MKQKRMRKGFSIVCAMTRKSHGLGFKNRLPWPKIKEDMDYFYSTTTMTNDCNKMNSVIMGRNTWESIPEKFRPLPNRLNIVVTSNPDKIPTIHRSQSTNDTPIIGVNSLDQALNHSYNTKYIENTFVIGGQKICEDAIQRMDCSKLFLTYINKEYESDVFFPKIPKWMNLSNSNKVVTTKGIELDFETYDSIADPESDEIQYTNLLKDIIENGESKDGRNGQVISLFGPQHTFDLQKGFPLLTTKRMFFDGVIKELIFFLRGETDANILSNQGVRIWDGNTSREFLDSRGLNHCIDGDLGPMYGYNFRAFGAPYEGCDKSYVGKGYDQLWHLVNSLVNDPNSRRHLMTTYNPATVKESVLAPCHGLTIQFNVRSNGELDCKMYQRS